jgi:hypothetical protein
VSLYVLAMACVLHGSCSHGYFVVQSTAMIG